VVGSASWRAGQDVGAAAALGEGSGSAVRREAERAAPAEGERPDIGGPRAAF